MTKIPYSKPAITYSDQLAKLKRRGLTIDDEPAFLELLKKKSYYRLSGYWYPLLDDKANHVFKQGASFNSAYNLYKFDRDLRQLVVMELEKIEIAVRAKMIYILSHQFGPFWYTDNSNFKDVVTHAGTLNKISGEFRRSDAEFIKAFRSKYSNVLPPSWTAFEIISFGSISRLFENLNSGRSKRDVAFYFGLDDKTFGSWLHGLVYVRNVCAHHSRMWNRIMRIQPIIPRRPKHTWLTNTAVANDRAYFVLSMILYLLTSINEKNSVVADFKALLTKYPNVYAGAMGFPTDWETEPLWQE